MASFDLSNREHVSVSDNYGHTAELTPQEALDLLHWLSDRKDTLYSLTHQVTDQPSAEKHLQIHLHQEDLAHLDELKAVIPDLHEHRPVVKVLDAPLDTVTERALQLLKDLQIEYTVHPLLLEEHDAFAQG